MGVFFAQTANLIRVDHSPTLRATFHAPRLVIESNPRVHDD